MTEHVPSCTRCGRGDLFRSVHRDRQTSSWLCMSCDAPERFRNIDACNAEPLEGRQAVAWPITRTQPTALSWRALPTAGGHPETHQPVEAHLIPDDKRVPAWPPKLQREHMRQRELAREHEG